MYCSDKIMSRPIVPNTSHLHKVTSPTHNIPSQNQIPKKQPSLENSVVNSFLHSMNSRESPTRSNCTTNNNNNQLFKTHHTLKLSTVAKEAPKNQFGLRSANGCDGAVQNRVKNLNQEISRNSVEEPENVVVYRTKTNNGRVFGGICSSRADTPDKGSADDLKWKAKYEDAERKRKELLSESQKCKRYRCWLKSATKKVSLIKKSTRTSSLISSLLNFLLKVKNTKKTQNTHELHAKGEKLYNVGREKAALEHRLRKLEDDHKQLKDDFNNKTQQLNQLRRVSEQVYQDYDKLNNKYETETTTLHKALEVASKWYKENKKLKRESVALRSSMMIPANFDVFKDELDGDDAQGQDELEELRKTVQDLSSQVGQLQSELNKARLQEFEAQEQYINLTQALDQERNTKEKMEQELKTLRLMKDKFESVSYMVHDEMKALRTERDRATEKASRLQAEAQQAQKERNVLAHQSSLLMGEISSNETLMKVLLEVEDLKRKLEEETQNHALEVQRLQEKLESEETESRLEIVEEKLRLAEEELQLALQRAEKAEEAQRELESKVEELTGSSVTVAPPPPPLPPPPPPPPLPNLTPSAPLVFKKSEKSLIHRESIDDMANILGIQRTPKTNTVNGGAINDIINEIKGGKFTLKATEKQKMKKEEPPPAVQEMLNIIGTLKRRPGRSKPDPPDVEI